MLLFEFHGSAASVKEQAETVQEIARENGGMDFEWTTSQEERTRLWQARHNAYFATMQIKPGSRSVTTDVCVPISRLADCMRDTTADLAKASLFSAIVGHVGDGNFHVQILIDPDKPEERDEAEAINTRLVTRALAMDGTCTGEHGIGLHKMDFLVMEHGEDAIDLMRALKRAFDPKNLLNPGKIIRV
jgi:D-lactate dehydrogenase (cytochrome)